MVMKAVGKFAKDTIKGIFSHLIDPIFVKTKEFNYFIDLFMARNNMSNAESVYIKFTQVLIDGAKNAEELKYVKIFAYKIKKDLEHQYKLSTGKNQNDVLSTYFDYSLPMAIERKAFKLGLSKYDITIFSKQTKDAEKRFNENFDQFMQDVLNNKLISKEFVSQIQSILKANSQGKVMKESTGMFCLRESFEEINGNINLFGTTEEPLKELTETVYSLGLIAKSVKAQFKRDVLRDWSGAKDVWEEAVGNASDTQDIKRLRADYFSGLNTMHKRAKNQPNKSLDAHLEWITTKGKKMLDDKADKIFGRGTHKKESTLTENSYDEASAKWKRDTTLELTSDGKIDKFKYFLHCANTLAYVDMIEDMFNDFKQNEFKSMCAKGGTDERNAMWIMINVPRMIRTRKIDLFAKH